MLNEKIVAKLPLKEIWNSEGQLNSHRLRELGRVDIKAMLRSNSVRFVLADCGKTLNWIPGEQTFDFWKDEVQAHLAQPGAQLYLEEFPGEYCYVASEWSDPADLILLEKHH